MIRMLFWFFVAYVVWKIIEVILARPKRQKKKPPQHDATFSDVEEAKYEDVTPKSQPSDQKNS